MHIPQKLDQINELTFLMPWLEITCHSGEYERYDNICNQNECIRAIDDCLLMQCKERISTGNSHIGKSWNESIMLSPENNARNDTETNIFEDLARSHSKARVLIVSDEDLSSDKRVLSQLYSFEANGCDVDFKRVSSGSAYKLSKLAKLFAFVKTILFLLQSTFYGICKINQLHSVKSIFKLNVYVHNIVDTHFLKNFNDITPFYRGNLNWLENRKQKFQYDVVIANNLPSLLFVLGDKSIASKYVIYDTHEIAIHRFRTRMSSARTFFSFCLENLASLKANEIITVNAPLRSLYEILLQRNDIKVICNNLYSEVDLHQENREINKINLVFFGYAKKYRELDRLIAIVKNSDRFVAHFYLVGEPKKQLEYLFGISEGVDQTKIKIRFGMDYIDELAALMANGEQWLSWCLISDVSLSYRLSLPNKFIQSTKAKIRIISIEGSYLSSLTSRYNIGVSLKAVAAVEDDIDEIMQYMSTPYERRNFDAAISGLRANSL